MKKDLIKKQLFLKQIQLNKNSRFKELPHPGEIKELPSKEESCFKIINSNQPKQPKPLINRRASIPPPKNLTLSSKNIFICSYGGCGTVILRNTLQKLGYTVHALHSRNPPIKLEYFGKNNGGKAHCLHFNGIPIPDNLLENYTVIYIYKNPINAIYSRFMRSVHLRYIQAKKEYTFQQLIDAKSDIFGLEEFFDNYFTPNPERNYKIYCIKYEEMFDHFQEISEKLNLIEPLNITKKETVRDQVEIDTLTQIYQPLIDKMKTKKFLEII